MVSRNTTLVPSLGLRIGPACEAGLSANMRRERVSPQIRKKEKKEIKLWLSKTAKMLLQRKSLAIVAPSGKKYLSFMLLKACKWTVISPAKKLSNFSKTCFTTTKATALAPFNLAHPVCACSVVSKIARIRKSREFFYNPPGHPTFWGPQGNFAPVYIR